MKWRKWNRWIHRELGYLFFGMAIIYGVSGIALNHQIVRHWNASIIEKSVAIEGIPPILKKDISKNYIQDILNRAGETDDFKQYFSPNDKSLIIYLNKGHIEVDLETGRTHLIKISNRKVFREMNFLHYNKPKRLWTYFADLFAFSLILLSISGLFMVRGKKGASGKGGILVASGILVPLIFLILYLWA